MPVTRQGENNAMTPKSIQAMIDQEIQRNSTHTQDDAIQNSGGGPRRPVQPAHICVTLTWWNGHVRTLGHDAAYAMTWGTLKKKGNDVAAYTQRFQELALMCIKFLADETEKVDKYNSGLPDNIHGNLMSARPKTLNEAIEKEYAGTLPLCNKYKFHHNGPCTTKNQGHYKSDCPESKNQKNGNQAEGTGARGMVYALGGVVTDNIKGTKSKQNQTKPSAERKM
nr:hypothetical protein [Tanacetum cinerariifolium]